MKQHWKRILISIGAVALITTQLSAEDPSLVDVKYEKENFPALLATEGQLDKNIQNAYDRIRGFGHLVPMAKEDRIQKQKEEADPYDFKNTFRNIKFTPRNTYLRYVKESAPFILVGMGDMQTLQQQIQNEAKRAQSAGLQVQPLQFGDRDGIELTQFSFIYSEGPDREAIGSIRKSVTLFYAPAGGAADAEQQWKLEAVVTRLVEDDFKMGIKNVEVIYDPSPDTENMDDVYIWHRYNQKEPNTVVLGTMHNTANFPLRNKFKQKFYVKLMDHFNMLYRLVDGYSKKDGQKYNETIIEFMEKHNRY